MMQLTNKKSITQTNICEKYSTIKEMTKNIFISKIINQSRMPSQKKNTDKIPYVRVLNTLSRVKYECRQNRKKIY